MVKHKKIYLDYFGYGEQDFVPFECCHAIAVDIHHLCRRGIGGSKTKDYIENLMGLCRSCHIKAESSIPFNEELKKIHKEFLKK